MNHHPADGTHRFVATRQARTNVLELTREFAVVAKHIALITVG